MDDTATRQARAFRTSLDIDASPEEVWAALTQAEELVRWFPTDAKVTPGKGGTMLWSWGHGEDWVTRIDAWEPGRLLRLIQEDARPSTTEGKPLPPGVQGRGIAQFMGDGSHERILAGVSPAQFTDRRC